MDYKIVVDSSADMLNNELTNQVTVPIKIITQQKEYIDNALCEPDQMMAELAQYHGKSSTACPSVGDWLTAFGNAKNVYCLTITSGLSGSYNSACIAAKDYMEQHPDRQVLVIDPLSVGPVLKLLCQKIDALLQNGATHAQIQQVVKNCKTEYGMVFCLKSLTNLANNGRIHPTIAKIVGLLGIRIVGRASDEGTFQQLAKVRGEEGALKQMLHHIKAMGFSGGRVKIAHFQNESSAQQLKQSILAEYPDCDIEIYPTRNLCSYYAEQGGILIGFEK